MGSRPILWRVLLGCAVLLFNGVLQLRWVGPVSSASIGAPAQIGGSHASSAGKGTYALIIVVDAARFDEFDLSRMPNLAALAAAGTRFNDAWVGQLPSITETSHATIGTGVLPNRHLILGDTWRVPGTERMAPNLLNGSLVHTGYIGKLIQAARVPTLAGLVHARFPGSRVVALSGHKAYAADAMGAGSADFVAFGYKDSRGHYVPGGIPGHVPAPSILKSPELDLSTYPRVPGVEDSWTTTLALQFLAAYHPRLMMINLPEVDVFGHANGTDGTVMQPLMQNVDAQIGRLVDAYKQAGMYNQTEFVITSDHGMVPALRTVQDQAIETTIKAAGGQPLYVGHGDDCEVWLKNPDATPSVAVALAAANVPNVAAVYMRKPTGGYMLMTPDARVADPTVERAYSYLLSTIDSAEAPDLVLLYDENTMTMKPAFLQMGRKGDHGGATWGSQHIGLFLSGPGIKRGYASNFPARLVDLAPTVEELMGIRPRSQDGVPLADAMIHPASWALTQEKAVRPRLLQYVASLTREARLRPNTR